MRSSIPGIFAVAVVMLCTILTARAADPQPYRVDIASTGDGSLDNTLRATSELVSLRGNAPVSPFGLIARARGDVDRLKTVLESYGYYQSSVTVKIEGSGLNSGGIADALTALPKDREARVAISFELGPLYHVRAVTVDGSIPESAGAFSLKSGAPAVAADVLAAGSRLLATLQEGGYAFAKVDPPVAYEDATAPVLDVTFHVDAGVRVKIGEIRLEGLQRVHEKLVRHRLTLHSGQQYSSSAIEAARRDLLSLGPIAAISIQVGTAVDSTGGVPITFTFRERLRHAVTFNAAYSSDLGGSGGVTWTDRNVFGNAEQLNIAASVLNLGGGNAATGVGYDTSAKFTIPDFGHRDQSLQFAVGAIKQSLQAYDQKAVTSGVTLTRKLSSVWTASVGITTADEQIIQAGNTCTRASSTGEQTIQIGNTTLLADETCAGITTAEEQVFQASNIYNYTLVALPLSVGYDSTHLASPLDDPLHGMRDSLSVAPTQSLGHPNATFIITQVKFAAYFDLNNLGFTDPGRSVLAMRALAGVAQGAGEFSLPPDQRFYGGGSGTIRGYPYQAVGPQFTTNGIPNGNPKGGTAIAAGSLEFRQRFGGNFGGAIFVDGGQVSDSLKTDASDFFIGVGFGVRYYTPIGPIRLDVAFPTRQYSNDDVPFEIYIGLGQAF